MASTQKAIVSAQRKQNLQRVSTEALQRASEFGVNKNKKKARTGGGRYFPPGQTSLDVHVVKGQKDFTVEQAQAQVDKALSRFVYGCAIPFAVPEHALFVTLAETFARCGQANYTIKVDGQKIGPAPTAVSIPKRKALSDRLLDETCGQYIEQLVGRIPGIGGVGKSGWSMTSDKTTRYLFQIIDQHCMDSSTALGEHV